MATRVSYRVGYGLDRDTRATQRAVGVEPEFELGLRDEFERERVQGGKLGRFSTENNERAQRDRPPAASHHVGVCAPYGGAGADRVVNDSHTLAAERLTLAGGNNVANRKEAGGR